MVKYMTTRVAAGDIVIKGNHEHYVYQRLKATKPVEPHMLPIEAANFQSVEVFLRDKDLAEEFFKIFEASLPFLVLCTMEPKGGGPVFITHAPCDVKYLGKVTGDALREQRNYRVKDRSRPFNEELEWLYEQADLAHPLHIFGHVSHLPVNPNRISYKNKVFLDTGAVYGGRLSAAIIRNGRILQVMSVQCRARIEGTKISPDLSNRVKKNKVFDIADYDLTDREKQLVRQIERNEIKYISGTMAPGPSVHGTPENPQGDLESIDATLKFLADKGVTEVSLQPKFMGSRGQLYLYKDHPEKTMLVSRSGWKVRGLEGFTEEQFEAFLQAEYEKYKPEMEKFGDLILDGEILPWRALGGDLVDRAFLRYAEAIGYELSTLASDEGLNEFPEFLAKLDLREKARSLEAFEVQLKNFGKKEQPYYVPFDILWAEKGEVLETLAPDAHARFCTVSYYNLDKTFAAHRLDLTKPNAIDQASKMMAVLTEGPNGMEGLVAKPVQVKDGSVGVPPYVKIRNREYLRLVYGYNYTDPNTYGKLVRQKNISGKVQLSIKEHIQALNMLKADPEARKEIAVKLIGTMRQEAALDPRL